MGRIVILEDDGNAVLSRLLSQVLAENAAKDGAVNATLPAVDDTVHHGDFSVDRRRFKVKAGCKLLKLTQMEFRLFEELVRNGGCVCEREQLLCALTGNEVTVIGRNIDVHIRSIRKKLGAMRDMIETVRGIGYRLRDAES